MTPRPQGIPNWGRIGYSLDGAVVVVEGATHATLVAGAITMIVIGILLNIVGLGIFCWLLFTLAINALPFFVGTTAGIYSLQAGAGPFGAFAVGVIAGGFTLGAGRYAFAVARSSIVRLAIGLLFAVPAACAGFDATFSLAHLGIPSEWWRKAFAVFGAITVGGTAWARVSILTEPAQKVGITLNPSQPTFYPGVRADTLRNWRRDWSPVATTCNPRCTGREATKRGETGQRNDSIGSVRSLIIARPRNWACAQSAWYSLGI